jgi:hypothetical protein
MDAKSISITKIDYNDLAHPVDLITVCKLYNGNSITWCSYQGEPGPCFEICDELKAELEVAEARCLDVIENNRWGLSQLSDTDVLIHRAKKVVNDIVDNYSIIVPQSDEYYALWMFYIDDIQKVLTWLAALGDLIISIIDLVLTIYAVFQTTKGLISAINNYNVSMLSVGQTLVYSSDDISNNGKLIVQAQQNQQSINLAPDEFTTTTLKKGDIIYGLRDGQSAWYTTKECVELSKYDQLTINQGLQIAPNELLGYRKKVAAYEVTEDIIVPTGIAKNNTYYNGKFLGNGGYTQYYIEDYENLLEFIGEEPLKNITNNN